MKILFSILEELVACLTTQATGSGVFVIDIPLLRRQGFSSPGFSLSYIVMMSDKTFCEDTEGDYRILTGLRARGVAPRRFFATRGVGNIYICRM